MKRRHWSWRCARLFCILALVASITVPLPLTQTASTAVGLVIALVVPSLQERTTEPAKEATASREGAPHHTSAPRLRIVAHETRDVPFAVAATSVIVVSPDIATAQIKNAGSLTLTGLRVGETMLIVSDGRRRYTFLVQVIGRSSDNARRDAPPAEQTTSEQGGLSGTYALTYSAPFGDTPTLLRQSFEMRRALSQGRTLRFSGEVFKFLGQGDRDLLRATTPGLGLDRISLGVDTPDGTFDILDSQVSVSPLSFNNYTMRGFHLTSSPDSRLGGMEIFAGLARPSLSLLDDNQGRLAGVVLPVAQGQTWRVRAGLLSVAPQQQSRSGSGGTVWQMDGRYAPNSGLNAEGEAAYANGGLSWRARLDLRRGAFNATGEIVRFDGRSPLVSIGAQPGGRKTEALTFQWRPGARLNASLSYNHTAIVPPVDARRAVLDRTTLVASAGYRLNRNSRLGFRFTDQRIETGVPGGDFRFKLETRAATVSHQMRFNRSWANNLEARVNFSRESRAGAETERGLYFSDQLRFSWKGGSATGFVNYTYKTPSLTGLIVRNPQLLPLPLQRAFAADPVGFLQSNRDTLATLLPGVELPQTRSLETGLRLQAAFSRINLASEMRYSAGEVQAREQSHVLASVSAGIRLDAANSVQVSAWRPFGANGAGVRSGLTVSYVHRFGAGSGGGLQFSSLLGLERGVIQGRVFSDLNGNGRDDAGEPGLPGMRVQVDGNRSATTDASGRFRFQINPGDYSVALISAELGVRLRASTLTEQQVSLAARQTVDVSFGVSNFGTVGGRVFNDQFLTGGPPDANAPGVGGVRLRLRPTGTGADTQVVLGMADAGGSYEFRNLRPGSYMLEIDPLTLPANFLLPAQATWPVTVEPLGGFYLDIPLAAQRAVSGIVFIDRDGDGQFDPRKDEIVEGARVTAGRAEALSGVGGSYVLRNLPAGTVEIRARSPWGVESRPVNLELGAAPTMRRNINLMVTR